MAKQEGEYYGKDGQVYNEHTRSGKHYIYGHYTKDTNELFYIGLGKYNRCNQISKRNMYWLNIYKKRGLKVLLLETNLTIESAKIKEIEYIKLFKPKSNMTIGGEGGDNVVRKLVYCYDKKGNFINEFNSITEGNLFFNKKENDTRISRCLNGERKSAFGYIWKDTKNESVNPYEKSIPHNQKSVYRYDLNGNFVEKLEKISDFNEGNRTGISNVLDKDYTFFNSFWRSYYIDKIVVKKVVPALKPPIKIKNTETGEIFDSITIAAKFIGCNRAVLQRKINGERRNNAKLIRYEQVS